MTEIIALILPILLPIFAGWVVVQTGILKRSDSHVLSLFFLYLAIPGLLIHQIARQDFADLCDWHYIFAFLVLNFVLYGGVFLVEKVILKQDTRRSALAAFTASKFNAVILGLPILMGTLGEAASGAFVINIILVADGVSQQFLTNDRHRCHAGAIDQPGGLGESMRRTCWLTFAAV